MHCLHYCASCGKGQAWAVSRSLAVRPPHLSPHSTTPDRTGPTSRRPPSMLRVPVTRRNKSYDTASDFFFSLLPPLPFHAPLPSTHTREIPSPPPLTPASSIPCFISEHNIANFTHFTQTCAKCAGVSVLATLLGEQNRITRSQPWFNGRFAAVAASPAGGAAPSPRVVSPPPPPRLLLLVLAGLLLPSSFCRSEIIHVKATCLCTCVFVCVLDGATSIVIPDVGVRYFPASTRELDFGRTFTESGTALLHAAAAPTHNIKHQKKQ